MNITMLETKRGSPDGFKVQRYHKGCMYDVPHNLATAFIRAKAAIETDELSSAAAYERIKLGLDNIHMAKKLGWI